MTEVDKLYTVRCMVRTLHNKREIQLQWHNYKCSNKGQFAKICVTLINP